MGTLRWISPIAVAVVLLISVASHADVVWDFDDPAEVISIRNLDPNEIANGRFAGFSQWDPYVSLQVPEGGINADELTWLTVRLYSSAEADVLDIYYGSPDGRWCLGGVLPIHKGWATYRMDLTQNNWRETRTGEVSKQWGGPSKQVAAFRIDPGNQADRWIMIDSVRLQAAEAELEQGVVEEPMGTATLREFTAPEAVTAGDAVKLSAAFDVTMPKGVEAVTGYIYLKQGRAVMRGGHQILKPTDGHIVLEAEYTTSVYWNPGPLTAQIGFHELQVGDGQAIEASIEFANAKAAGARPPDVKLKPYGGDVAITVDGKPLSGVMYLSGGGVRPEYHSEVARAGVHIYADWFGTSVASDQGHVAPDEYTYGQYDHYFATVLDLDPDAYFLPHLGVVAPHWWQGQHPEELCRFENGNKSPSSFASELWKRDSGEDLRKLLAYLSKAPYADRILGYCVYGGYTAEWQMWGTWQQSKDDYSEPARKAFVEFLKGKYGTVEALRSAWRQPEVTFETAEMAKWAQRRPDSPGLLRDPQTEMPTIDFYEFINTMTSTAALHFADIAREETQGKQLIGTYYAYLSAHGWNQQDSGHCDAARVFDSPSIDFLMSPPNYWYRQVGEASTYMSATDSLRMRGKLWLNESDCRTFLTEPTAGYGRTGNLHDSLGVIWREFAEMLAKRSATSWFDMTGGWFSHPELLSALGKTHELAAEYVTQRQPCAAEVGVFVHPESFYWMRPTQAQGHQVLRQFTLMPQAGAPFDYCLLDDIDKSWMPDYKLYVFLNAVHLTQLQRAAIIDKVKRNGATAVFLGGAGYFDEDDGSVGNMAALTGITIAAEETTGLPQAKMDPAHPLAAGLSAEAPYGGGAEVSPIFHVVDAGAETIGTHPVTGKPVIAIKQMDGWKSVYSSAFELPATLMRNLARQAGVHIWVDSDDAVYADGGYVGLHAATAGEKTILLPVDCTAVDVITGRAVPVEERKAHVQMEFGDTVLLRLTPRGQ